MVFKVRYSTSSPLDLDDTIFECESAFDPAGSKANRRFAAADAADDFHSNHDGWEASWPHPTTLVDADDKVIAAFEVDREHTPEFYAQEINLPAPARDRGSDEGRSEG